jgi:hypothetical protein
MCPEVESRASFYVVDEVKVAVVEEAQSSTTEGPRGPRVYKGVGSLCLPVLCAWFARSVPPVGRTVGASIGVGCSGFVYLVVFLCCGIINVDVRSAAPTPPTHAPPPSRLLLLALRKARLPEGPGGYETCHVLHADFRICRSISDGTGGALPFPRSPSPVRHNKYEP